MWLKTIVIKNFKSIESLQISFDKIANVIVGPNAIGKTTILDAIRLVKASLAPRTQDETLQAFISLGAISPHNQMQMNFAAIARDNNQAVKIVAVFELSDKDILVLDSLKQQMATLIVQTNLGQAGGNLGPLSLIQHLSSAEGQAALSKANQYIDSELPGIQKLAMLTLDLTITNTGNINGKELLHQIIFQTLEARLPAHHALFSHFPADRALPTGDVNIQIGGADVAAQLQSHNSLPQAKFGRLKTTIVSNFILNPDNREALKKDFDVIFSKVLKERALEGLSINPFGQVAILIKETKSGRIFDIDAMSSGEKGLILTFLLVSRSIGNGGIITLDEPELHLNPAVCKTILPFLIEEYLVPNNIQAIICSHSPELLGTAFDSSYCALLHIQSSKVISRIYPEDRHEVFDALRRLGTSKSDALFSAGSIFVEGEHDIEILQAGFGETLLRYNISSLGGRHAVEQEIITLQAAEQKNELDTLKCFIFDLDKKPSSLSSTRLVKVLQWKRRCLENYLIDEKIIYNLLKDPEIAKNKIDQRGQVAEFLKNIALKQLNELIAHSVYEKENYNNPGFRPKEVLGKSYSEMSGILFGTIRSVQNQLSALTEIEWRKSFEDKCEIEDKAIRDSWEIDWPTLCDGKRFFKDLHQECEIKMSPLKFKKIIVQSMEREKSETWVVIKELLNQALEI